MKHHKYKPDFNFYKKPEEFNKYTEKILLQYCLGANLYMPGKKDMVSTIINKRLPGLTSMVRCFEDAISDEEIPEAERNVLKFLDVISEGLGNGSIEYKDIPLFFLRVRNPEQFKSFSDRLKADHTKVITGFVFPKFTCNDGDIYLNTLQELNLRFNDILYGMPILESSSLAFKETRNDELVGIRGLLKPYKDIILNIRVGATDLSSRFGVRRGINYSIYDILPVRDCLSDILNFLNREGEDYVISAPVWEYFLADKNMKFEELPNSSIHDTLLRRHLIVNEAIDGLLREVILDKANGFIGKTIIHPSHLKYVNAMQSVTKEEYDDAIQILQTSGGVIKSANSNKMNEINPHRNWANRIYYKAKAYGVIEDEAAYIKLFM